MKKQTLRVALMFGLLLAMATATAHAQTSLKITATIPFNFNVGDKVLPAGDYVIRRAPRSDKALVVESADGHASAVIITDAVETDSRQRQTTKLEFRHYGEQFFLHRVWTSANATGRQVPTTRRERILQRETARNTRDAAKQTAQGETVSVMGTLR
jgi:hypothetical protein